MDKSIFISHAKKDEKIIEYFLDEILIGALNFHHQDIFCTSADGMKIPSGSNWRDSIKAAIASAKIIILIITSNYKESEICQNELGAAWVSGKPCLPLIIDPIDYKTAGVIQDDKQIEKLLEETGLDRIRDTLGSIFSSSFSIPQSDRWTKKKLDFLSRSRSYLRGNPFKEPLNRDTFDTLQKKYTDLQTSYDSLMEEKSALKELVRDLENAKDRASVRKVKSAHGFTNQIEEFKNYIDEIDRLISSLPPVIATLIYNNYTNKNLTFEYISYRAPLETAIANEMIYDDLKINWNHPIMKKIKVALDNLSKYMKNDLSDSAYEELTDEYPDVNLEITNLEFWKSIMNITMYYD